MKRVIAKMHGRYNSRTDEYTETLIQYLQQKVTVTFFGKKIYSYWETIDKEEVPSFAWMQSFALGFTDWKSKWYELEDVLWITPKK